MSPSSPPPSPPGSPTDDVVDFLVVGSGFGGSVSALRLREKGYSVLVLERGRRFRDQDFARSNWNLRRYLWAPALRCFGILQISPFRDVFVLHGAGVGGGSLGYANVLQRPSPAAFATEAWRRFVEWGAELAPHYDTAARMLGVAPNPRLGPADEVLRAIAADLGTADSFQPTTVGAFFGEPGREGELVPDPYFGGEGPPRRGCQHCGACMVGCRHDAKNTLVKNYLWFAERRGATVLADREVTDIRPLAPDATDGARFAVHHRSASGMLRRRRRVTRARHVVVAAGALGTLRLLLRCRDVTRSLPRLGARLGDLVRTNSEAILGSIARGRGVDYSKGIAITSIVRADPVTTIEPVRYPAGSSAMRFLSGPLITSGGMLARMGRSAADVLRRPRDFAITHFLPGWAQRGTVLLVMQHVDNRLRLRLGRSAFTFWRRDLVSRPELDASKRLDPTIEIGHRVTREFARRTGGIPMGSINESLFGIPMTAHILGGVPMAPSADEGVVDLAAQAHGYPGLYVVDGSIVPANPGVNPSLTITAMAEWVMAKVEPREPSSLPARRYELASESASRGVARGA